MSKKSITIFLLIFILQVSFLQAARKHQCPNGSENTEACTLDYNPVCGYYTQDCPEGKCPQTYPNSCSACAEEKVKYYTEGQCEVDTLSCAAALFPVDCPTDLNPVCANVEGKGPTTFENACWGCREAAYSLMKPGACKEDPKNFCEADDRDADCISEESSPVCGAFREGCPEGLCYRTYDSACSACQDETVVSWEDGACDQEDEVLSCAAATFPTECPTTSEDPVCASLPSLEGTGESVMTFPNFCVSCRNAASSLARPGPCPYSNRIFNDPEYTPEICTAEINPVCGYFTEGCPQGACPRTYDAPCAALQDETVVYYTPGECAEQVTSCAVVLLPEVCPEDVNPVCSGNDEPRTYDNLCIACKADASSLVKPGACREE